jgi:hypothetical protein
MLSDDEYVKEVNVLNRVYALILELAARPNRPRPDDFRKALAPLSESVRETTLLVFLVYMPHGGLLDALDEILRAETTLRGTQCLVALRRWQFEHEALPKDLDTLVKAAGMPRVPIDPFSGQPLRMTVIERKPVIYSVGPDGKDDKAILESKGGNQPGDLIFRLESSSDQRKPGGPRRA